MQTRLFGEHVPHRPPREHAPNALANHYRCRDGRWFIMALFNEQRQLRPFLARSVARNWPTILGSPRSEARKQNAPRTGEELDEVFATRDMPEWRRILDGVGVTFGMVATVNEVLDDPQMRAIGALVPFAEGSS